MRLAWRRTGGAVQWLRTWSIQHALQRLGCGALALALGLGAVGCADVPLAADASGAAGGIGAPGTPTYRSNLDLSGRLSLSYQQDGKEQALHGNFEWHQRGAQLELTLRSPLGQTLAQIEVQDGLARLTESGGRVQTAAHVDDLVQQTLGWPLPVANLQFWLQGHGQQANGQPFQATPAHNQLRTPDGWQLHFVSWHANGSPKRIDLARATAAAGEVVLKLIINEVTVE